MSRVKEYEDMTTEEKLEFRYALDEAELKGQMAALAGEPHVVPGEGFEYGEMWSMGWHAVQKEIKDGEQMKALREALAWYADPQNYINDPITGSEISIDGGAKAVLALANQEVAHVWEDEL